MRPVVDIWIGIKGKLNLDNLPESIEKIIDEEGEIEQDGLLFEYFSCADETAGFGVELFSQFHFEINEFDIESLCQKTKELKPQIEKLFKEWNISEEVNIYIVTGER